MDIGSIFLILALLTLVGLYISRPLFEHSGTAVSQEEQELSALMAERDRILNAIQELEFDHILGKIPEEDYPSQRQMLMQSGASIMRQIDEHGGLAAPAEDLDTRLESAIAARRATSVRLAAGDDDIENMLAARRRERQERAAGFCPQCGGTVQRSDKFCPKCGTSL